jgi:hypothetical protein
MISAAAGVYPALAAPGRPGVQNPGGPKPAFGARQAYNVNGPWFGAAPSVAYRIIPKVCGSQIESGGQ